MEDTDFLSQAVNLQQHSCNVCGGGEIVMILQNTLMVTQKIEHEQQNLKLDCRDKLGFLLCCSVYSLLSCLPHLQQFLPVHILTASRHWIQISIRYHWHINDTLPQASK